MVKNRKLYTFSLILIGTIGFLLRLLYYTRIYHEPYDFNQYVQHALYFRGQADFYGVPRSPGLGLLYYVLSFVMVLNYDNLRLVSITVGSLNCILAGFASRSFFIHRSNIQRDGIYSLCLSFLIAINRLSIKSDNLAVRSIYTTTILLLLIWLISKPGKNSVNVILVGLLYFILTLFRSEFAYVGVLLGIILYFESIRHDYDERELEFQQLPLREYCFAIIIAAIFAWTITSVMLYSLFGTISADSKFLIQAMVDQQTPGVQAEGITWYIFQYLGLPQFIIHEFSGIFGIIQLLPGITTLSVTVLIFYGIGRDLSHSLENIPFLLLVILYLPLNGFNAYAFGMIGYDRIMSMFQPIFFIYAIIGLDGIYAITLRETSDHKIKISSNVIQSLLLVQIVIEFIFKLGEIFI